jgi:hypothetical protein
MEWVCIDNWEKCIQLLRDGNDTVGCNLQGEPTPHYSGNFWWTTSSHIRALPLLEYPHQIDFRAQVPRISRDEALREQFSGYVLDSEFWVCSVPSKNYEVANACPDHLGWHYQNFYPMEKYMDFN